MSVHLQLTSKKLCYNVHLRGFVFVILSPLHANTFWRFFFTTFVDDDIWYFMNFDTFEATSIHHSRQPILIWRIQTIIRQLHADTKASAISNFNLIVLYFFLNIYRVLQAK